MPKKVLFLGLLVSLSLTMLGDTILRTHFKMAEFDISRLLSWWLIAYGLIKMTTIAIWLFLLSKFALGRLAAIYGISSMLLTNVVGIVFLREILSVQQYVGLLLAVIALALLAQDGK